MITGSSSELVSYGSKALTVEASMCDGPAPVTAKAAGGRQNPAFARRVTNLQVEPRGFESRGRAGLMPSKKRGLPLRRLDGRMPGLLCAASRDRSAPGY